MAGVQGLVNGFRRVVGAGVVGGLGVAGGILYERLNSPVQATPDAPQNILDTITQQKLDVRNAIVEALGQNEAFANATPRQLEAAQQYAGVMADMLVDEYNQMDRDGLANIGDAFNASPARAAVASQYTGVLTADQGAALRDTFYDGRDGVVRNLDEYMAARPAAAPAVAAPVMGGP